MNAIMLGATLYVPVLRPNVLDACTGGIPELRSLVICLEDSIRPDEVDLARQRFSSLLRTLAACDTRITIFARPRDMTMLSWMLDQPGIEAIDGFVLPKVDCRNVAAWISPLIDGSHLVMPTIEGAEAFDRDALVVLRSQLQSIQSRIATVRIGGNDILSLFGARRSRVRTAYDGPLGDAIRNIAGTFIPAGFAVSAPVFEHYSSVELLREEVERDIEYGLLTKTAIHTCQIGVIQSCYRPTGHELAEATAILELGSNAVFGNGGSMCEPATHASWAANVLVRARTFGVAECDKRPPMKVA